MLLSCSFSTTARTFECHSQLWLLLVLKGEAAATTSPPLSIGRAQCWIALKGKARITNTVRHLAPRDVEVAAAEAATYYPDF